MKPVPMAHRPARPRRRPSDASPPQFDLVCSRLRIPAQQRHLLDLRLGNEQPVERVAVMVGRGMDTQRVRRLDREHAEAVAVDLVRDEGGTSGGRSRRPVRALSAISQPLTALNRTSAVGSAIRSRAVANGCGSARGPKRTATSWSPALRDRPGETDASGVENSGWPPISEESGWGNQAEILAAKRKAHAMAKNTICLWYDKDAEAAARFYSETFPDSRVSAVHRAPSDYPSGKQGDVLTVDFTVAGIPCLGLNGGPAFKHSEAFSFQIATDDQEETDRYWNAIVGNGGQESACGWCKDKWGLSWQITPRVLTDALAVGGAEAKRAFDAMMTMRKIDVAAIEVARRG